MELLTLRSLLSETQPAKYGEDVPRFLCGDQRCESTGIQAGCTPSLAEAKDWLQGQLSRQHETPPRNFSKPCPAKDYRFPCQEVGCPEQLNSSVEERLRTLVYNPRFLLSEEEDESITDLGLKVKENDIIIVSAASSDHYDEMQAMFRTLHQIVMPKLGSRLSLVLIDIGLNPQERNLTEQKCRCQVITFPMNMFPDHVSDLLCYSWKPIIVRAVLPRAKELMIWMDSSIRPTHEFLFLLYKAQKYGIQHKQISTPLSSHTLRQTTDYFQEAHCAFRPYPEYEAGLALFRNDKFIYKLFLEPWAKCALVPECMCPVRPANKALYCKPSSKYIPAHCHRFDQSVMTMISAKLFQNDVYRIVIHRDAERLYHVKRHDKAKGYFNSLN